MIRGRANNAVDIMDFFINGDWDYCNKKVHGILNKMSKEEQEIFFCDVKEIVWDDYLRDYIKGLAIWGMNEDQIAPEYGFEQIIYKNKGYTEDFRLSFK